MRSALALAAALLFGLPALALAAPSGTPPVHAFGALGHLPSFTEGDARAYLAERAGLADVDLAFDEFRSGLALRHVRFVQTVAGLPVEGTRAQVSVDATGAIRWVIADVERNLDVAPCPDAERSSIAIARSRLPGETWSPVRAEHMVNHHGETVWRVSVALRDPLGAWKADVACDGSLLRVWDAKMEYAPKAKIFPVSPIVASADPDFRDNPAGLGVGMEDLLVEVELLGMNDGGSGLVGGNMLRGKYAWIVTPLAVDGGSGFVYDRGDPRFEETNAYYYTDWAQRHIQSLGFDNVHNQSATIVPRVPGAYTAFYTGDPMTEIFFGYRGVPVTLLYGVDHIVAGKGGLADAAEDAHVILHEYGHAVLDDQAGICCTEEAGAMHEAFGDWQAASMLTRFSNGTADGCMAPWFGSYLNEAITGKFPCYRDLNNDKTMDDWKTGDDAHFNQLIWSGALWKTEQAFMARDGREAGAAAFERLMYESNFLLPREATLKAAVHALLVADAVQNAGVNRDFLAAEFVNRKIVEPSELPSVAELRAVAGRDVPIRPADEPNPIPAIPLGAVLASLAALAYAARRRS